MNVKDKPIINNTAASATTAASAPVKKPTSTVYPESPELEKRAEEVAIWALAHAGTELYDEAGFPQPMKCQKFPVENGTSIIFSSPNIPLRVTDQVVVTKINGLFTLRNRTAGIQVITNATCEVGKKDLNQWAQTPGAYKKNPNFVLNMVKPSDWMARGREATQYLGKTYKHGGRFPMYITWSYAIQKLLDKLSSEDALTWHKVFGALKLKYSFPEELDPPQAMTDYLEKMKIDFEKMCEKFLQLEKTDKNPELRKLCNLLLMTDGVLCVNLGPESEHLSLDSTKEYEELIDIISFVEKVKELFPIYAKHHEIEIPSLLKIFPKKHRDFPKKRKEILEKIISGLADLQHATVTEMFRSQPNHTFFSRAGKEITSIEFQISYEPQMPIMLYFHYLFVDALAKPILILIRKGTMTENHSEVEMRMHSTAEKFAEILAAPPKATPEVSALVQTLRSKGDKTFQQKIISIMPFIQKILLLMRNGLTDLSPFLQFKTGKGTSLLEMLKGGFSYLFFSEFKRELTNLSAQGAKLNKLRQQVLVEFEKFLTALPADIVAKHGNDILETVEELHVHLAVPITTYFEFLFGMAYVKGTSHFIFSDDSSFEPEEGFVPLQDFLLLKDADRVLHKVKQNANAKPTIPAPKPTPKEPLAALPQPTSSAALPPDNADPKKKKVKTRPAIVYANFFTAAQSKPAAASDPALPYIPAPTKLRKLNQLLTALNFHYLGKGKKRDKKGNDESKGYVTVSRGAGRKNVPTHVGSSTVKTALSKTNF